MKPPVETRGFEHPQRLEYIFCLPENYPVNKLINWLNSSCLHSRLQLSAIVKQMYFSII